VVPVVALTLLAGGFAAGLALEWLVWRVSPGLGVLAHPNARSSHTVATPTAGGIAFVLPLLGWLGWLAVLSAGPWLEAGLAPDAAPVLALAAGGFAIALVGLWDDLYEVAPLSRLLVHVAAAVGFVVMLLPDVAWILLAVMSLVLVWHINLYNFMDGIDGLAGAQGLLFLVGAQIVGQGVPGWPGDVIWLTSGALIGFLVFNWPPARIFMGDVGSGFLGLLTGALALLLWQQQTLPLAASLILLSVFWFDASYTLALRVMTGQPFARAHRSHLYQKLAARRGHRWTTVAFLLYGAFWLVPLAWACAHLSPALPGAAGWIALAVAPLALAAVWQRAGLPPR
jgi:Fuc2NAc and GlcNAc transferase